MNPETGEPITTLRQFLLLLNRQRDLHHKCGLPYRITQTIINPPEEPGQ